MRLLLDAHALLWWLDDNSTLSSPARDAITDPANDVYVSAVTAWEIAIKQTLGNSTRRPISRRRSWATTSSHCRSASAMLSPPGTLPRHHDDPFDRMLIAQARMEQLTTVTRDARFSAYGIPLLTA